MLPRSPRLQCWLAPLLVLGTLAPWRTTRADDAALRANVLRAIERGQQYLLQQQAGDGSWNAGFGGAVFPLGTTSLGILALLNTGMTPDDPPVAKALKHLRSIEDPEGESSHKTYEISLQIQALAAARSGRDRPRIQLLTTILEDYQRDNGGWKYQREDRGDWDHSAGQFAILGLREAAMSGVPVDHNTWRRAQELWLTTQTGGPDNPGGAGWGYTDREAPYGSMTVAGVASLITTSSFLQDDSDVAPDGRILCCQARGDDRAAKAIKGGVRWLSSNFSVTSNPAHSNWLLYYMYGLERAGRFSGVRFFGDHDWYREGAEFLVAGQDPRTGSFSSQQLGGQFAVVDTCFALLFLSKGLAPVVINKLSYGPRNPLTGETLDDNWSRHPRDISNLVDHLTTRDRWPQFLNWQVVDLKKAAEGEGVAALLQAPIQFLSGSERPDDIQGAQLELLREYLLQGGFLFAMQNCENAAFDQGFRDLVQRLFPNGEFVLRQLPPTHDVYRSETVFAGDVPELWGVDFGCRTGIIYAPFDHACRWRKWARHDPPHRLPVVKSQIVRSMNLGVNVIAYATGRELVDKLRRPEALGVVDTQDIRRDQLTIARLRHTGGWDTAPSALRHLHMALERVGVKVSGEAPNLPANDPALFDFPLLYMHGRKNFALTQGEIDALRTYLENGGVLFADACCGAPQFDESFRTLIEQIFERPLERIPSAHEVFKLPLGYDIRMVSRRIPFTDQQDALVVQESVGEPVLEGIEVNGRYVVLYSKFDLSCALEQQNTIACAGYSREDAAKIAVNLVLYGLVQ